MSKGGQIEETPAQRAMTEHAVNLMQDYKKRWEPVQLKLAGQIEQMGAPGSAARKEAAGKSNVDTQAQFAQAEGAVEKSLSNAGALPGSGKANLAVTGLGSELAGSKGIGATISDQQIDEAYTQGLAALMNIGKGKAANVANSMAQQAALSGAQARASAGASAEEAQGRAGLVGQAAGYGLQSVLGRPNVPAVTPGSNPTGFGGTMNNPSAYVPPMP